MACIVSACMAFFATTIQPEDCNLAGGDNPEKAAILKESLNNLSAEAKLMIKVIFNLPDACFYDTGKLGAYELESQMFRRFKWDRIKTSKIRKEIREALGVSL